VLELESPGLLELDALGRALERHAALARVPEGQELQAFVQATVAWDAALKSTHLQDVAAERAQGQRPGTGADAVDALRNEVEEELAAWALAHELPLGQLDPGNDLEESVAYRVRDEVLARVDSAADDISRRLSAREPLAIEDEWRLFLSLQRQYDLAATVGGYDARRFAFEAVNVPLCNLGAWLFNERGEKAIANGMFRWLLDESLQVGTDEDQERYKNNVRCGP
jgi:hypothetical protein